MRETNNNGKPGVTLRKLAAYLIFGIALLNVANFIFLRSTGMPNINFHYAAQVLIALILGIAVYRGYRWGLAFSSILYGYLDGALILSLIFFPWASFHATMLAILNMFLLMSELILYSATLFFLIWIMTKQNRLFPNKDISFDSQRTGASSPDDES
jgi:hypothetical protein